METRKIDLSKMTREELENEYVKLSDKAMAQEAELNWLKEQVKLAKNNMFGQSSEKGLGDGLQQSIFNEAELYQEPDIEEPSSKDLIKTRAKAKKSGSKKDKIKDLPVERVEYRLSEEDQICPRCGAKLHEMKKEIRDEIEVIPAQYKVNRSVIYTYSCRNCDRNGIESTILRADAPAPLFRNSLASPSFVADIICRKYVLALPLYRQAQELQRYGLGLFSRQTISNWVVNASTIYLKKIYDRMKESLISRDIIHADETEVEVLHEPGRPASSKSYMWVYTHNGGDPPCFIYEYAPGRGSEYPKEFLKDFHGYLQTDGYGAYDTVANDPARDSDHQIIQVGCFAHARRKFTDALKASSVKDPPNILKGIQYCDRLFNIEDLCKEMSPEDRKTYRLEHSAPVLDEYFTWLRSVSNEVLPKSKLGKAVQYSLNQEEHLRKFLVDGRLEISNNRAERAVKPFVIGRKNWLFANTPDGANASAVLYSIAETAKACQLKPFEYFKYVLTVLSQKPDTDIDAILPWAAELPEICHAEPGDNESADN